MVISRKACRWPGSGLRDCPCTSPTCFAGAQAVTTTCPSGRGQGSPSASVVRTSEGRPAPWWCPGTTPTPPEGDEETAGAASAAAFNQPHKPRHDEALGKSTKQNSVLIFASYITNSRHCSLCKHINLLLMYQQNYFVAPGRRLPSTHVTPRIGSVGTAGQGRGWDKHGKHLPLPRHMGTRVTAQPGRPAMPPDRAPLPHAWAVHSGRGCSSSALRPVPPTALGAGDAPQQDLHCFHTLTCHLAVGNTASLQQISFSSTSKTCVLKVPVIYTPFPNWYH